MSVWTRKKPVPRYEDPTLHPGEWGGPTLQGSKKQQRVVWSRVDGFTCSGDPLDHRATVCSIGPGMAHVDVCQCGAERYGVFGAWS